jgi:glycine cleavage system H lipoate-binding protein
VRWAGWVVKVKVTNPAQLNKLMDEEAYKKHCESAGEPH